jgi:hypothetical protein
VSPNLRESLSTLEDVYLKESDESNHTLLRTGVEIEYEEEEEETWDRVFANICVGVFMVYITYKCITYF